MYYPRGLDGLQSNALTRSSAHIKKKITSEYVQVGVYHIHIEYIVYFNTEHCAVEGGVEVFFPSFVPSTRFGIKTSRADNSIKPGDN